MELFIGMSMLAVNAWVEFFSHKTRGLLSRNGVLAQDKTGVGVVLSGV